MHKHLTIKNLMSGYGMRLAHPNGMIELLASSVEHKVKQKLVREMIRSALSKNLVFSYWPGDFKLFFAPELRDPLRLASNVLSDVPFGGRTSRKDKICCDRYRMFPCAIRTVRSRSPNTACWPSVNRNSRPHLPNSSSQ